LTSFINITGIPQEIKSQQGSQPQAAWAKLHKAESMQIDLFTDYLVSWLCNLPVQGYDYKHKMEQIL
jgi:hypothetical protein